MGRLDGSITKDFFLSPEWVAENSVRLDDFCESVAQNTVLVRQGSYDGNGLVRTITVGDLPQAPILVLLQPAAGGTPFLTLVPYATGAVTAWTKDGFTLAASGFYNTPLVSYFYLVLA